MFWAKVGGISATLWLVSFADPKALFFSVADRDTQGKGLVSLTERTLTNPAIKRQITQFENSVKI